MFRLDVIGIHVSHPVSLYLHLSFCLVILYKPPNVSNGYQMARENMREFGISDTYVYHLYSNWANGEETKMDIELHPPKPTQVPRWDTKRKDYCLQTITTHLEERSREIPLWLLKGQGFGNYINCTKPLNWVLTRPYLSMSHR